MNKAKISTLFVLALSLTSCIGIDVPQPFSSKPYTYFKTGDQFGRDQLTNRSLVGMGHKLEPLKGRHQNEILTLLGQPQRIDVTERDISEDWHFVYFKKYVPYNPLNKVAFPDADQGEFIIRFYHEKVIDVVTLK